MSPGLAHLPPEPYHILVVAGSDFARDLETILAVEPMLLQHLAPSDLENRLQRLEPDALLLDGRPGIGTGLLTCRRLKSGPDAPDLPILVVGPGWDGPWVEQVYAAGAADYISHPLRAPEVLGRVRSQALLARVRQRLKAADGVDPITGLPGAARFRELLHGEWERTGRSGTPVAILVAGVDGFETYAGENGPGAAAACLAAVGQAIAGTMPRVADLVAHLEEGEYGCILPDTDVPGALAVALKMQERIRALRLPFAAPSRRTGLTLSVGFAAAFTTQTPDPEELLARARRNLDLARARGGGCWSAGEEEG